MLSGGLIVHNEEKNSYYDKFRNRLMFPVKITMVEFSLWRALLGEDPGQNI